MKNLVPILVATNALALGLVAVLWVQQGDLESRLGTQRSDTTRRGDSAAVQALENKLSMLEARFATRPVAHASPSGAGPADIDADFEVGHDPSPDDGIDEEPSAARPDLSFDAVEMDLFRAKVRKAQELNASEDRLNREIERVDRLAADNRIGALTRRQKEVVAQKILDVRAEIPNIWRKVREGNDLQSMSREDRGALIRSEYDSLRAEAQKALEDVIPAADAKTILDASLADRGGMFRGAGGPGRPGGGFRGGAGGR